MPNCSVSGCRLASGAHLFPKDPVMKRKWEIAVKKTVSKHARICRNHFKQSDYSIFEASSGREMKILKKDAVPSIFSWTENLTNEEGENSEPDLNKDTHKLDLNEDNSQNNSRIEETINNQESNRFNTEIEISSSIFPIDILKNNNMMLYYTGLESYDKFAQILSTLTPECHTLKYKDLEIRKLTVTDYLLLTLMKLRRNKSNTELAFLFSISKISISNIFAIWINFVYKIWSDRYFFKFNVPEPFGTDPKVILIKKSCSPFLPEVIDENLNNVEFILNMIHNGNSELRHNSIINDIEHEVVSLQNTFKILKTDLRSYNKPLRSQIIFVCLMIHKFGEYFTKILKQRPMIM